MKSLVHFIYSDEVDLNEICEEEAVIPEVQVD